MTFKAPRFAGQSRGCGCSRGHHVREGADKILEVEKGKKKQQAGIQHKAPKMDDDSLEDLDGLDLYRFLLRFWEEEHAEIFVF